MNFCFTVQNYLIELLVILVQAHHPGDAVVGSDEALAGDWNVWKRHLLAIYCLVQKELYNYQISRRSNYQLNEHFITLAVAVMKQVSVTTIIGYIAFFLFVNVKFRNLV